MAYFDTTVATSADPHTAFRYLADFSNAADWDPSVPRALRLDEGLIGEGARFRVELALGRRTVPILYTLERCEADRLLVFRADEPWFRSLDTIELAPRPGGTEIRYDADLRLEGVAFLLDPLVHVGFQFSGQRSADGLRRTLNALPRTEETEPSGPRLVPAEEESAAESVASEGPPEAKPGGAYLET